MVTFDQEKKMMNTIAHSVTDNKEKISSHCFV